MSALTDLFTALANKIRSKTGGSTTYTPPQMVNAIDDVYAAGAASVTGTSITPSNTSPQSMSSGTLYKPTDNGYAIQSYTSISQSQLNAGVYFSSGMKKMASSGYAYSSQPSIKETTLWTNSSPTSNFAAQTITLLQDIDNFDYLKITYRLSTSASTELSLIISVQDFKNTADANGKGVITLNSKSSNVIYARLIYYASDTSVSVTVAYKIGSSGNSQAYSIPTKISGLKY